MLVRGVVACTPVDGLRGLWLDGSVPVTIPARVCTRMGLPGAGTREPRQVPRAADTYPRAGGDSVAHWCCVYFWLH